MSKNSLKFLHLSDIHFKNSESVFFKDLRNQLELDAQNTSEKIGPLDGILVSGDIAFSGKADDYQVASEWIDSLCAIVGCSTDNVWSVPGNHDIEWEVVRNNPAILALHAQIRAAGTQNLDDCINDIFLHPASCDLLYQPIENYVTQFATKYNSTINREHPYVKRDLPLNDGSILRIIGVNSTLVSSERDNDGNNKLIVGSHQSTMHYQKGVEYLLMCHHPYSWLLDHDDRKDHWSARAKIQVFGHKHRQRVEEVATHLILGAGAMQPDKHEPEWEPRYNYLEIAVANNDDERVLNVKLHRRIWKNEGQGFQCDYFSGGADHKEFNYRLDPWEATKVEAAVPVPAEILVVPSDEATISEAREATPVLDKATGKSSSRQLVNQFASLPRHRQLEIIRNLDILTPTEHSLPHDKQLKLFFKRLAEKHLTDQLLVAIEAAQRSLAHPKSGKSTAGEKDGN